MTLPLIYAPFLEQRHSVRDIKVGVGLVVARARVAGRIGARVEGEGREGELLGVEADHPRNRMRSELGELVLS